MYYKHNPRIAGTILKVIGENPSEMKYETVRYPERMSYYSIRKKVYERLSHAQPPYHPSQSHFDKNMLDLVKWNLIIKKPNKKNTFFALTDLGKICVAYDYEPSEYYKSYMIWGLIAFRAIQGVWKNPNASDPLLSHESFEHYHKIPGINAEDILMYKSRIRIPHNLFNELISTDELSDHIRLLAKEKILVQNDNNRYVLSPKYHKFVVYVFIILIRDIQQTLRLRWKIISGSKTEEKKWYQFWYGDNETRDTIERYTLKRSNYKSHLDSKDLRGCRRKIRRLNNQIIRDYETLKNQCTEELNEIPGFSATLLSHACPTDLKDLLKKIEMTIS